jgi:hypothetical protein
VFEAQKLGKYALGAGQPPSSDPCSIYRNLCRAIRETDDHDDKIISQKSTIMALAVQWCNAGTISENERDEVVAIVNSARFPEWRPLIFVVPYGAVHDRVREVERARRASTEPEYIIPDLKLGEFDIIEPAQ